MPERLAGAPAPQLAPMPAAPAPAAAAPSPQGAAPQAPPDLVLQVTGHLVDAGLLGSPSDTLTPEVMQALQFLLDQAGIPVDLNNPDQLLEFLNVVVAGANIGPDQLGAAGPAAVGPDLGPSGVEPIAPEPAPATGLNAPGPKRITGLGGGGGGW